MSLYCKFILVNTKLITAHVFVRDFQPVCHYTFRIKVLHFKKFLDDEKQINGSLKLATKVLTYYSFDLGNFSAIVSIEHMHRW